MPNFINLKNIWRNFIHSGFSYNEKDPLTQKVRFINFFLFIGFIATIAFLVRDTIAAGIAGGLVDGIVAVILLFGIFILRYTRSVQIASNYILVLIYAIILFFLYVAGSQDAYLLLYTAIIVIFLLKGTKGGVMWVLPLLLGIINLLFLRNYNYLGISIPYTTRDATNLLIQAIIVSCFIYYYEYLVESEKKNLREEKDKTETILQSIGDGVFVLDRSLNIILFNNAMSLLTGYSYTEAVGKKSEDIIKFVYEGTTDPTYQFITDCLNTGMIKEENNPTSLITKSNKAIYVSNTASPLKDFTGKIIGCVVACRDITREREIDKAKTEFVSLASHQLRTPLSSINWYLEMLLDGDAGKLNTEQKDYLEEVAESSKRMSALVGSLLNVSRIDLGTFRITPVPTDLTKISKSLLKELTPQLQTKALKVIENYDRKLGLINLDPELMRMVLQNLLSNAVKYTPEKGTITITAHKDKKESPIDKNGCIRIEVADTGYGIPESQKSKIFTKLFRADNVTVKAIEGTGLGLYIVKSIIDNSGGRIWFESEENKGTTFFIELPLSGMEERTGEKSLGKQ